MYDCLQKSLEDWINELLLISSSFKYVWLIEFLKLWIKPSLLMSDELHQLKENAQYAPWPIALQFDPRFQNSVKQYFWIL